MEPSRIVFDLFCFIFSSFDEENCAGAFPFPRTMNQRNGKKAERATEIVRLSLFDDIDYFIFFLFFSSSFSP